MSHSNSLILRLSAEASILNMETGTTASRALQKAGEQEIANKNALEESANDMKAAAAYVEMGAKAASAAEAGANVGASADTKQVGGSADTRQLDSAAGPPDHAVREPEAGTQALCKKLGEAIGKMVPVVTGGLQNTAKTYQDRARIFAEAAPKLEELGTKHLDQMVRQNRELQRIEAQTVKSLHGSSSNGSRR
jgi:hypothetical protein